MEMFKNKYAVYISHAGRTKKPAMAFDHRSLSRLHQSRSPRKRKRFL